MPMTEMTEEVIGLQLVFDITCDPGQITFILQVSVFPYLERVFPSFN